MEFWGWVLIAFFLLVLAETLICLFLHRSGIIAFFSRDDRAATDSSAGLDDPMQGAATKKKKYLGADEMAAVVKGKKKTDLDVFNDAGIEMKPYSPLVVTATGGGMATPGDDVSASGSAASYPPTGAPALPYREGRRIEEDDL